MQWDYKINISLNKEGKISNKLIRAYPIFTSMKQLHFGG